MTKFFMTIPVILCLGLSVVYANSEQEELQQIKRDIEAQRQEELDQIKKDIEAQRQEQVQEENTQTSQPAIQPEAVDLKQYLQVIDEVEEYNKNTGTKLVRKLYRLNPQKIGKDLEQLKKHNGKRNNTKEANWIYIVNQLKKETKSKMALPLKEAMIIIVNTDKYKTFEEAYEQGCSDTYLMVFNGVTEQNFYKEITDLVTDTKVINQAKDKLESIVKNNFGTDAINVNYNEEDAKFEITHYSNQLEANLGQFSKPEGNWITYKNDLLNLIQEIKAQTGKTIDIKLQNKETKGIVEYRSNLINYNFNN